MSDVLPTILSAIAAFLATLSAGIFIKKFKSNIGVICAFSSGFFIALALFEIFPHILELAPEAQISLDRIIITSIVGFVVLLLIERSLSRYYIKDHRMAMGTLKQKIGVLSTLEFCSHGLLEGIAIGVSFQLQFELGILVAIAVISHDFCDGISTLALMLNSGNTLKSAMNMLFVDAIAPVLGAASTLFFAFQNSFLVYALSFLSGSFLYIGIFTLLPDAHRMNRPIITIVFFLIGFFLILLFTRMIS